MNDNNSIVREDIDYKRKQLEELRREIIEEFLIKGWKDVWFYPPYEGVMGYLGTQDIMFVGLNPSCGYFPSRYDEYFYGVLKENGLQNAHLTDVIKVRIKTKEVEQYLEDKDFLEKNLEFFKREIEIIDPKIIVAMGENSNDILTEYLREYFPKYDGKIHEIRHYSFRFVKKKELPKVKRV